MTEETARHPHWPKNVRGIGYDGIELLGVDDETPPQLYWDGRLIEVRRRLDLTFWQKVVAAITALAVIVGGLGQGIPAIYDFASKHWLATPASPAEHEVPAQPAPAPQNNLAPGSKFQPR